MLALLCLSARAPQSDVRPFELPSILSDGCVLQRNDRVPLWGTATPGTTVRCRTSLSRTTYSTEVQPSGQWFMPISTPDAGGPHEIALLCGESSVRIRDVWSGEVWIGSGQSNMEMPLDNIHEGYSGVIDYEKEIAAANHPNIRLFQVPNAFSLQPQSDCEASWTSCTPENVKRFSSTAYFFGRELHEELDVPVGLISADFGGTEIEAWLSPLALSEFPGMEPVGRRLLEGGEEEALLADLTSLGHETWTERVRERGRAVTADWTPLANWSVDAGWQGLVRVRGTVEGDTESVARVLRMPSDLVCVEARCNEESIRYDQLERSAEGLEWTLQPGWLREGGNEIELLLYTNPSGEALPELSTGIVVNDAVGTSVGLQGLECRRDVDSRDLPRPQRFTPLSQHTPGALFNAMIAPIRPYGIRGVIWYQGESNIDHYENYGELLKTLVQSWRREFLARPFSFYAAQIAPFGYDPDRGRPGALRDQQLELLELDGTGLVSTLDIGNATDIHPKNKQEVGRRFARWALHQLYGKTDLVPSGPLPQTAEREGDALRVRFRYASPKLVASEGGLADFELAGADGVFHDATATIDGESLLVRSDRVPEPVHVRYAHGATDAASLFNEAGLPAPSFQLP